MNVLFCIDPILLWMFNETMFLKIAASRRIQSSWACLNPLRAFFLDDSRCASLLIILYLVGFFLSLGMFFIQQDSLLLLRLSILQDSLLNVSILNHQPKLSVQMLPKIMSFFCSYNCFFCFCFVLDSCSCSYFSYSYCYCMLLLLFCCCSYLVIIVSTTTSFI